MLEFGHQFFHRHVLAHPYALIDAAWRDELPSHWNCVPLAPPFLGNDISRCPVLIDINSLAADEAGTLMDGLNEQVAAREDTVCSLLLQSKSTLRGVANHLGSRIAIDWPRENSPKQFRFFDPGSFLQLPHVLGEEGMSWLLGPISSVLVPWAGQWAVASNARSHRASFRLNSDHREALVLMGAVNRVAMQLEPPESAAAWVEQAERIRGHLKRALFQYGLVQQDDLVAFGLHACKCHPLFDTHPLIADLMVKLRNVKPEDELDYRELTARLNAADWARVQSELRPIKQGKDFS